MADDLVRLGVTNDLEALIWRDTLAQEAIPVFIRPSNARTLAGVGPAIGDVQVHVRAADERRARWIIGDAVAPLPQDEEWAVRPDGSMGD